MKKVMQGSHLHVCIEEDGFHPIQVEVSDSIEFDLEVAENINASLFLTYSGVCTKGNVRIHVGKYAKVSILFWNKLSQSFICKQDICMKEGAQATIAYGELEDNEVSYDIQAVLSEQGADLSLFSATVSASKKHFEVSCVHEVAHTSSNMEHYAVIKDDGDYFMKATGEVKKGAYESSTHQVTRVLTMSEKQKSEVIPLLLIDENDVKASHATSLGQPDENQLYYLQTRGLSRKQALALLTVGYIMPIKDVIQQEDLQMKLQEEIERKVGLYA